MSLYNLLYVRHATVAQFEGVSAEDLPQFMASREALIDNRWAFCLRMRKMRHLLVLNALRRVFKRVIYVVRKILSREMKDYNNFTHISNTVDIHSGCRDFG